MKYSDFITLVSREVRDSRAWPDDQSKLDEQLSLSHVAVLSVAANVPAQRLSSSTETLTGEVVGTTETKRYPLPDDLFDIRDDAGIKNITIDGEPKWIHETLSPNSVIRAGKNSFQKDEPLFAVDISSKEMYVNGATEVKVDYAPEPSAATAANYDSEDLIPLSEKDVQRAVHIVSAHVSGVQIRDNAASTFHSMLEQFYAQ